MMRLLVTVMVATLALAAGPVRAQQPALETEDQKTLYMLGVMVAQRIGLPFEEGDVVFIKAGLGDGLLGLEPRVPVSEYAAKIQPFMLSRSNQLAIEQRDAGKAFREKAAQESGAVTLDSGVVYFELEPGSGATPAADDRVTLHYHGQFYNGRVFDSSRLAGAPQTLELDSVIPCFGEALQRMKVGGRSRVICPPSAAYGDAGAPPKILPGATLDFDVELLGIVEDEVDLAPAGSD